MVRGLAVFGGLVVLLHPVFLVIYRLSVFGTVPRDDYGWFLLWLLGLPGGFVPDSPYVYRVGSMVLAAGLAWLPAVPLTNVPAGVPVEWLRATAALSMLAFLCWVGTAQLCFLAARKQMGVAGALAAGGLGFALVGFTQVTAIDPLAVLLVAACVLFVERPWVLAGLLAVSVPVNEKVALVMAAWLGLRCVLCRADRARLWRQAGTAVAAVGVYGVAVAVIRMPGNSYQRDPGQVAGTVLANLAAYGTVRGLLLNVLPLLVLGAVAVAGAGRARFPFSRLDGLVVPALAGVALVLTQFFQAGRIAMHAAPILVVPAAGWVVERLRAGSRGPDGGAAG